MPHTDCKSVSLHPASILRGAREYHCTAGVRSARTAAGYSPALSAAGLLLPDADLNSCHVSQRMAQTMVWSRWTALPLILPPWGLQGKGYALAGLNSSRYVWNSTCRWAA